MQSRFGCANETRELRAFLAAQAGTLTKPSLPETCSAVGAGEHSSVRISASAAQFCATAVSASDGVQLPVTVATSAG